MKKKFEIIDEIGLHARPATKLVTEASKYTCDMELQLGEKKSNLKSIMGVMSLGVKKGDEIIIVATGEEAETAIAGITKEMIELKIGETRE